MKKEELITKLKSIVEPYIQDEEAFKNLNEATDFVKDLKINSANLVDVILDVEDAFDIKPSKQTKILREFMAIGVYNQFIYVNPSKDIVVVKLSAFSDYATIETEEGYREFQTIEFFRAIGNRL